MNTIQRSNGVSASPSSVILNKDGSNKHYDSPNESKQNNGTYKKLSAKKKASIEAITVPLYEDGGTMIFNDEEADKIRN
jgi:hypothetical protein